jgi:5'-AMP-activated protein kinase, catalytic alpha subunit
VHIGREVDVWNCGGVLYVLLCGFLPFNSENTTKLRQDIKVRKQDFYCFMNYEPLS